MKKPPKTRSSHLARAPKQPRAAFEPTASGIAISSPPIIALTADVTRDLFINYRRVRSSKMFRFLTRRADYLREAVEAGDEHHGAEPITVSTWQDAVFIAKREGAAFIVAFHDTKILFGAQRGEGKQPLWINAVVVPHPVIREAGVCFGEAT